MTDPFHVHLVEETGTAAPALGPAVSPRTAPAASPLGELDEPLAPFTRSSGPAPAPAWAPSEAAEEAEPAATPAVAAPEEEDSLAWLWADDSEALSLEVTDEATLEAPDPWAAGAGPLPPRAEVPVPAAQAEEHPSEWMAAIAEAPEAPAPAVEVPDNAPSAPQHPPAVLQEVAERLERIARSLRDQQPAQLFGESGTDPLQLLITGYALGFSEAMQREEARGKREE